ncbi:MAG TPA: NUDIX domain-containing protein [Patescibacteria group bacterium]|nr:NUDIX domain-containing protein [Patescibacteria group bacterium]
MKNITIVNEKDEVVGAVTEKELYEKKYPHRIVHVLLFNSKGEIMLQMRSQTKSYAPAHWVTSAGGRVDEGETYEEAAYREMREEIGLTTELKKLYQDYYERKGSGLKIFMTIFSAQYQGEQLALQESEVERVEFFGVEEIKKMIRNGEKITDELRFIFEKHF